MEEHSERIIHTDRSTPYRHILSASTLTKDPVRNRRNENIGSIREIMIDVPGGRIAYAVLSVGGFFNIGDRLFAIPWEALTLDEDRQCFVMDVDRERLENAPGFDKSSWPDMADDSWSRSVLSYWTVNDDYGIPAGRRYDDQSKAVSEAEIERKAQEARRAVDGPEAGDLKRAEEIGKQPIKK